MFVVMKLYDCSIDELLIGNVFEFLQESTKWYIFVNPTC